MSLLTWNEKYSVSVKELDNQHQKLFALVNELYDAMKVGKGNEVLGKILGELTEYTLYHFRNEENMFQKYNYPAQIAHKQEHDALTKKVAELKTKFAQGNSFITTEVMNFLKDWLNHHIMQEDKKYGPFLNQKGVK